MFGGRKRVEWGNGSVLHIPVAIIPLPLPFTVTPRDVAKENLKRLTNKSSQLHWTVHL